MHLPAAISWALMTLFVLLAVPSVYRLANTEVGWTARETDLAELLMVLAMVAMVSPLGGPIPAAGWQAVLVLTAGWFAVAAVRGRRCCALHHAVAAAVMLYMITAMPSHTMDHGPWLTVSAMGSARLAFPALAAVAAVYFAYDAARVGRRAVRNARSAGLRDATFVRPISRAVMDVGMSYLLVAAVL